MLSEQHPENQSNLAVTSIFLSLAANHTHNSSANDG